MLILVSQYFEKDKGLCLGNDYENDKSDENSIQETESKDDKLLLLASQKSKRNQWYLKNDDENSEISEGL